MAIAFHENGDASYFGIPGRLLQPTSDELIRGDSVKSIGADLSTWSDPSSGIGGVWVQAVILDSAADELGLRAGDLITSIGGRTLRDDPTLRTYCDVLHSADEGQAIPIRVLRVATSEHLEGQLFGEPLRPRDIVATTTQKVTASSELLAVGSEFVPSPFEFVPVESPDGGLRVEVPDSWVDVACDRTDRDLASLRLEAAASCEPVTPMVDLPGLSIEKAAPGETDELLGRNAERFGLTDRCVRVTHLPYDDGRFVGALELWSDCTAAGTGWVTVALDMGAEAALLVNSPVTSTRDVEALAHALETLELDEMVD